VLGCSGARALGRYFDRCRLRAPEPRISTQPRKPRLEISQWSHWRSRASIDRPAQSVESSRPRERSASSHGGCGAIRSRRVGGVGGVGGGGVDLARGRQSRVPGADFQPSSFIDATGKIARPPSTAAGARPRSPPHLATNVHATPPRRTRKLPEPARPPRSQSRSIY
jgi:hypothetical protein